MILEEDISFLKHIGGVIIDMNEGYCELGFDVQEMHKQHLGIVHGGAIATLADNAGWYAVMSLLGEMQTCVTIEMKVNYLKPASGENLLAQAKVINRTKKTAFSVIEIFSKDILVAYASATYMIISESKEKNV